MTASRACHGKKAHSSAALAERHRQRLVRNGASLDALDVYRCRHCSTTEAPVWHVGHNGRRSRRNGGTR